MLADLQFYPLFLGFSWALGFFYLWIKTPAQYQPKLPWYFLAIFLSSWLGAKIFYLLFFADSLVVFKSNFWLAGGFVFYGGLAGAIVFTWFYQQRNKQSSQQMILASLMILPFLHGIGRAGCYLSGCCYGSIGPFAVQLVEMVALMLIFTLLCWMRPSSWKKALAVYLLSYGLIRFVLEFFREDVSTHFYLTFSQWFSLCLLFALGMTYFKRIKNIVG